MAVTSVPALGREVHAAGTSEPTKFATVEQLKAFNTDETDGTNSAKLYFGKDNQEWWIAGSQGGDSVTLFSASPLMEETTFCSGLSSDKPYEADSGCIYETEPSRVYHNHYGTSPMRTKVKQLEASFFSTEEQGLMKDTTIYTYDTYNEVYYATADKLYLVNGIYSAGKSNWLIVGENGPGDSYYNGLRVDSIYWGEESSNYHPNFWLRIPAKPFGSSSYGGDAMCAKLYDGWGNVSSSSPGSSKREVRPTFELDLSPVLFASAAEASLTESTGAKIGDDAAMSLRLDGADRKIGTVKYDNGIDGIVAQRDADAEAIVSLVIQGNDGTSDWYYSVPVGEVETAVTKEQIQETCQISGDIDFADCVFWLEMTLGESKMPYAKMGRNPLLKPGKTIVLEGATIKNTTYGQVQIDRGHDGTNDVRVELPGGKGNVQVAEDGRVTVPAGGKVRVGNEEWMTLPNGGIVDIFGNVEADGIIRGGITAAAPEGGKVTTDVDGKITVPAGGKVQTGEGEEMGLPNGGTVDKDGTVEADKIVRGETTVTAPEGGKVTADKDGKITVPAGGKVQTGEGEEMELPEGGTVDKDGNVEQAGTPGKPFEGSGTAEDPYQIGSRADLEKLRDLVNGGESQEGIHFKVTADIDLGGSAGNPWTPIGTEEHPFKGILDGNSRTVSGLYINDANGNNQGLFGVNGGTIKSLTVSGTVTGKDNVGGIAGSNTGAIRDCTTNVDVSGEDNVGGIAGKNEGTIMGCMNNGSVTGTGTGVGGITGNNAGTVNVSGNTGDVSGNSSVGGIAGRNDGTLDSGTNTAPVAGKDDVGGIAGTNGTNGTVEGCTNSGNVTGTGDGGGKPGAIIGNNQNTNGDAVKNDYYQKTENINKDLTGIGEGTGSGTDPAGIASGQTPINPGKPFNGSGTAEDPYQIGSRADLERLRDLVNGGESQEGIYFKVTADIDLGGSAGNPWTPIGTEEHPFKGTIEGEARNGDSPTVSGLYIDDASKDNQGLFGVNGGTIKNLTVEGTVTGRGNVGGIAGRNDGTIISCMNRATVAGNGNDVGGVAGINAGTIRDSFNTGTASGKDNVGGIAGTNTGTVSGGGNSGEVSGSNNVGGIIGNNAGEASGFFNSGKVDGKDNVGGIAGTSTSSVSMSNNGGEVSGVNNVGGIVGHNTTSAGKLGNAGNNTNFGDVTGTGTGVGGIAGKNDSMLSYNVNEGKVTGGNNAGGIAGDNGENGSVKNDTNSGEVTGGDNVGGIAGNNAGTISGEENTGDVSGNDNVGGITGNNGGTGIVEDSTNNGTVTGGGTGAGGIAGRNDGTLKDDTNTAPVAGKDDVGGIAGTNGTNGTVEGCTNSGNVTSTGDGGGKPGAIIGNNQNTNGDAVKDDYYQKTDEVNKDLTGIGEGTGSGTDPAGITSGQTPIKPGDSNMDQAAADHVKGLIDAIPSPVKLDGETKQKIDAARAAYEGLTAAQKALVPEGTRKKLEDAEKEYSDLERLAALPPETKKQVEDIAETLGISIEEAQEIQKIAKDLGVDLETLLITDDSILGQKSESDIRGSVFSKLQAKATKITATKATLTWKKVKGADGYLIYGASCGKNNKLKLLKTLKGGNKQKYTQSRLKKNSPYKYVVRAYKLVGDRKITISASKMLHVFTTGKYVNAKGVKLNKTKASIKKGKTFRIKAKVVLGSKKGKFKQHRKICYESSNAAVATVTKKGVIKGKKKGTCSIYVYAQNGVYKTIKVTVK